MTRLNSVNRVAVEKLLGTNSNAAGTLIGRRVLCQLIQNLSSLEPGPIFLDFSSVATASASFLREAVLAFRSYVLDFTPGLYPVVANAPEAVLNDLEAVLEHRKDTLLACRLMNQKVADVRVLGPLDPGLARALQMVRSQAGLTAGDLAKRSREKIRPGAWHNRLAMLCRRGLIVENGEKPAGYRFVLDPA